MIVVPSMSLYRRETVVTDRTVFNAQREEGFKGLYFYHQGSPVASIAVLHYQCLGFLAGIVEISE